MQYKGHFIQEHIDRDKIRAYFNFFKKYNHLYKDFEFIDEALDEFENETLNKINNDESDSSSDEEDDFHSFANSSVGLAGTASLITDKYLEDSSAPTVANKLADMVVQFETLSEEFEEDEAQLIDPEDEFYSEDLQEDDNEFAEDFEDIVLEDLSIQDMDNFELYKYMRREIKMFDVNTFKR